MVRIENLCLTIGNFSLRHITLHIRPGEYFVLLGKPGSGKTLLLECLAGLRRVESGTITFGEKRVDFLEPAQREVGYVPQDYALFSTKTVRENIEFGLRVHRFPRQQRQARVTELADWLGIRSLLNRHPEGLSGGEKQRVALARALALRPRILLLDEPVNALDSETRDSILAQLQRIPRGAGTAILHVCHDLDEMRAVADRVGILRQGRLVQTGSPEEIRQAPADSGVARLFRLGTILEGRARAGGEGCRIDLEGFSVTADAPREGPVEILIRSAGLEVTRGVSEGLPGRVRSVLWGEATVRLDVDVGVGSPCLRAEIPRSRAELLSPARGKELGVVIPPPAIYVFPRR